MDWKSLEFLADDLAVPEGQLGRLSKPKREDAIAEAVGFPTGPSLNNRRYTPLYGPFEGLSVAVGKPGKEADPNRAKPNLNDMTPTLLRNGQDEGFRPSFGDVFSALQEYAVSTEGMDQASLHVIGALLFRNAFMLDHVEVEHGVWRYQPPEAAVTFLEGLHPMIGGVPVRPFLHLIESLALNEDVKYNPPGGTIGATGRQNTLLTCVHATSVFLNLASFGRFVDGMSRGRGVAPLSQQEATQTYKLLRWRGATGTDVYERSILDLLRPYLDTDVRALAGLAGIAEPKPKQKDRVSHVFRKFLKSLIPEDELAQLLRSYNLKVVRADGHGTLAEDVSFPSFREQELILQNWSKSPLRELWGRPFLFVVFSVSDSGAESMLGAVFCEMPEDDLEDRVRGVWEATAGAIVSGKRGETPKKSTSPFFVRNHASKRRVDADGEVSTPLAFWLARDYVSSLMSGSDANGIGVYER